MNDKKITREYWKKNIAGFAVFYALAQKNWTVVWTHKFATGYVIEAKVAFP